MQIGLFAVTRILGSLPSSPSSSSIVSDQVLLARLSIKTTEEIGDCDRDGACEPNLNLTKYRRTDGCYEESVHWASAYTERTHHARRVRIPEEATATAADGMATSSQEPRTLRMSSGSLHLYPCAERNVVKIQALVMAASELHLDLGCW